MWRTAHWVAALALCACVPRGAAGGTPPLVLERIIELPDVKGRIDHLALDTTHARLYVAALGNGTVEVVDLEAGRAVGRISGLAEPQGLAVIAERGELAVASGGDVTLRFYRTADLAPAGVTKLGEDADNVRLDRTSGRLVVGFGSGALATVDPATRKVVGITPLPAHPEGFQLVGGRAYVNLPDAGRVGVADLAKGQLVASWPTGGRHWNFPLAVDPRSGDIAIAYRLPARVVILDAATGAERQAVETCGDSDDLFFDPKRPRLYVICGDGRVDVFARRGSGLERMARMPTIAGARTGLFAPERDRLYVAARASNGRSAAILVLRPQ